MSNACCTSATPTVIVPVRIDAPPPADAPPLATGAPSVTLAAMRRGQRGQIRESRLTEDDAALLRAMGLCTCAEVRLCRGGDPCVISVGAGAAGTCRIGLARRLAELIDVTVSVD